MNAYVGGVVGCPRLTVNPRRSRLIRHATGTAERRITSGFSCFARGFKPRVTFRFAGCCWWRPLAVDGGSGTSRGHAWRMPAMRRPGARRPGAVVRPSAFQAPSAKSEQGLAVSTMVLRSVDATCWLLLLLSSLLSAAWAWPWWTHGLRGGLSRSGSLSDSVQFSGVFLGTIAGRVGGVLVEF